ncbi:RNA polymerase sigma factor [Alicyclobacillus fodiniaquatilis]|uniref:RNA polymerase sigma factor n=1 Tax=Alicyclobacillus fodiniaquatilis TaxID=1661150 RepID=A0ABW4JKQ9_9BACL
MLIEDLYYKHGAELKRFAKAIARNEREAEDLLQETFLRALSHTTQLASLPESKRRAWLFTVLRNDFYDRRRKARFEVPLAEQFEPALDFAGQSRIEMQELLEQLPSPLRDIVHRRYWLGMNSRQIADTLELPAATVRHRLHTAIKLLRKKIRE